MPHTEKLNDLHGRTMVNIVSGETFHVYDKNSSRLPKPPGWLSLGTMEDEINRILSRAESKFCAPTGGVCTPKTVGLLGRRHITAGDFHYIGKEASTRWAIGPDPSMLSVDREQGLRKGPRVSLQGIKNFSLRSPRLFTPVLTGQGVIKSWCFSFSHPTAPSILPDSATVPCEASFS
jgi:hypothetical protein